MSARGYGAGRRARVAEAPWSRRDLAILVSAACIAAAGIGAVALGALGFDFYPELDPILSTESLALAAVILAALGAAAWAARR
jgi:hypothetical protein